jgi:hypothetical protein
VLNIPSGSRHAQKVSCEAQKVAPLLLFRWASQAFPSFVLQLVSEKVGGAEGTKLDDDFKEMEKVRTASSV